MSRLPNAANLLQAARESVLHKLLPALPEDLRYEALMVANALAISLRESRAGGDPVAQREQEWALVAAIRAGRHDHDAGIARQLRQLVAAKLAISNPKRQGEPPPGGS